MYVPGGSGVVFSDEGLVKNLFEDVVVERGEDTAWLLPTMVRDHWHTLHNSSTK